MIARAAPPAGLATLLVLFLAAVCEAESLPTLDLEQAIELAVEGNLTFALRGLGPERGRLALESARDRFAVEIRPELLTERTADEETVTLLGADASRRFRLGTTVDLSALQSVSGEAVERTRWSVAVHQPLLRRFGRLVNEEPVVRARSALEASERVLLTQEADLVLDVVSTYQRVLRLQQQAAADEKALERVRLLARTTRAKERLGRSTRVDTLRVDLELGRIETRLESVRESLELARSDLAVVLGAEIDARFELQPVPDLELAVPPLEKAVEVALEHRLDYAQALADLVDSRREVRIARRGLLPELAAFVRYEGRDLPSDVVQDEESVLFGLTAGSDVFRRDRKVDASAALLDESASLRRVEILEQVVERSVQAAWLAHRRARSQLAILERNLEHAEARLELASRLYRMGRGDNFSVVDAEEAFARAESSLLEGRAEVTLEAYRLLGALGTLVEAPHRLRPTALLTESSAGLVALRRRPSP